MSTWLISDLHFFHTNVIKYCNRPFSTVEEMNEALITSWNNCVQPLDIVYVLGDFSLAFRPVELFSGRLNGIKYLVPGNHDFCHSYNKKSRSPENRTKWIKKYEEHGWLILPEQTTLTIPGVGIVNLCHMPYPAPWVEFDKFAKWRLKDEGVVLLHGHSHSPNKFSLTDKGTLMIDVGVDAWQMKPANLEDIKRIILSAKS